MPLASGRLGCTRYRGWARRPPLQGLIRWVNNQTRAGSVGVPALATLVDALTPAYAVDARARARARAHARARAGFRTSTRPAGAPVAPVRCRCGKHLQAGV